ncbi:MAG: hypothetical protein CMO98_08950 [Woeseia sp.]|nr:hypothetical protein [Woeseia sp.]
MTKVIGTLFFLMIITCNVMAHHSSAMFDKSSVIEKKVTVIEFQWTNPHVWIEISILTNSRTVDLWSIEGRGPNSLFREGWRPHSLQPGDVITIRFNPMRDGSNAGGFIGAKFEDGRILGQWPETT